MLLEEFRVGVPLLEKVLWDKLLVNDRLAKFLETLIKCYNILYVTLMGGGISMVEAHATNNSSRSAQTKGSIRMGLTYMERRSLEASIKKNQKALDLLSRH
jgi:hypothetical protein